MRAGWLAIVAAGLVLSAAGCVTAPERIEVNVGGGRPPPVDSSRVPQPATLEEAHAELVKAYQSIQYLERESARQSERAEKYKHERDECRRRLKKYEGD